MAAAKSVGEWGIGLAERNRFGRGKSVWRDENRFGEGIRLAGEIDLAGGKLEWLGGGLAGRKSV